ncbi:Sodium/calcium exchanger protein [Microdochium nivale]|nr:Sodium/calcium exchanger protein [Microdochium nivale]
MLTAPEDLDSDSDSESNSQSDSGPDLDFNNSDSPDSPTTAHTADISTEETPLLPVQESAKPHSYVLSRAATNITDQLGLSDVLFGVVFLAIATKIPKKYVALMSGSRGHLGILVVNTVGGNIFLLPLCVGIIMVDTCGVLNSGGVEVAELVILWASTLAMTLTVWFAEEGRWC